jgi:hypothetical protein
LAILSLIAIVAAAIFSSPFFIKPKYKSTVIMFPTTTNSASKALLSITGGEKQDLLQFGEEEQGEQLLQILNSDEIRQRICQKYNLMEHYGIDPNGKYPQTTLGKVFTSNISFERTEFMSVKIDVLDTDPQMAADIANDIAALLDSTKTKMQRTRALEGLKIVENEYNNKLSYIQGMEDSLKKIREKGVVDYRYQARILSQEYVRASGEGNSAHMSNIKKQLAVLAQYGGAYVSLSELLKLEREELTILKTQYEKAKVDAEQNLPHKFIVNNAYKAEKKTTPVRWLIVVLTFLSTLFFAFLAILIFENYQQYKSSQNNAS